MRLAKVGASATCRFHLEKTQRANANKADMVMGEHLLLPYPLVNEHNYGKSPFLIGKSTINGHFQ